MIGNPVKLTYEIRFKFDKNFVEKIDRKEFIERLKEIFSVDFSKLEILEETVHHKPTEYFRFVIQIDKDSMYEEDLRKDFIGYFNGKRLYVPVELTSENGVLFTTKITEVFFKNR